MLATFIGNTSMGFISGNTYDIYTMCKNIIPRNGVVPNPCLCVFDKNSKAWCPYSNLERFFENWKVH